MLRYFLTKNPMKSTPYNDFNLCGFFSLSSPVPFPLAVPHPFLLILPVIKIIPLINVRTYLARVLVQLQLSKL